MAHRLHAKVQFAAIDGIKNWVNEDPKTRVMIVLDHKQKILNMRYREGQVDYFGKKGMSLLGTMIIEGVTNVPNVTWSYKFVDYIVKGYTGEDVLQVCSVITEILRRVSEHMPDITDICLQSDNASCFASQDHIPYIYLLNKESHGPIIVKSHGPMIVKWIFTEAQTGRGRLDTHFSYVNMLLQSYIEGGNDILTEDDIFNALTYNYGIYGSTAVLLDASNLIGPVFDNKETFKVKGMGSRETHEISWLHNCVHVIASSNITEPVIVKNTTLSHYKKKDLCFTVEKESTSQKEAKLRKTTTTTNLEVSNDESNMSRKASAYLNALSNLDTKVFPSDNNTVEIQQEVLVHTFFTYPWAVYVYPHKLDESSSNNVYKKLSELYNIGSIHKSRKFSPDAALRTIVDSIIHDKWDQRIVLTVPKIKAFFQNKDKKKHKQRRKQMGKQRR